MKTKKEKKKLDINSINNSGVVQHVDKKVAHDVDFYNKFVRKEGQPILTKEQYSAMMEATIKVIDSRKYPITEDKAFITGTAGEIRSADNIEMIFYNPDDWDNKKQEDARDKNVKTS
jgi:hypothetical protein